MKKNIRNIEKRIDTTMHALDNVTKAKPKPFLYARIKTRIDNRAQENFYVSPFLRYATICIIIIMTFFNILTASQFLGTAPVSESMDFETDVLHQEYYSEVITIDDIGQIINE